MTIEQLIAQLSEFPPYWSVFVKLDSESLDRLSFRRYRRTESEAEFVNVTDVIADDVHCVSIQAKF